MPLLTALIAKNSLIWSGIYFIFLKVRPRPNSNKNSIPNLDLTEKIGKIVIK